MSCIIGLKDETGVWMGCDGLVSTGSKVTGREAQKVVQKETFLFGTAGSSRKGQILRATVREKVPEYFFRKDRTPVETIDYMIRFLFPGYLLKGLRGYRMGEYGKEDANTRMLLATKAGVFSIGNNWSVTFQEKGYGAIGSGEGVALGALYTTPNFTGPDRLRFALEASNYHINSVGKNFILKKL